MATLRAHQPRQRDLLDAPVVGRFLRWKHARTTLQAVLLAVAALILYDGFWGPQLAPKNLAGVLPWVHWRGFVVLALLVAGNLFCMACPFMLPRRLAKKLLPADRPWPAWLRSKWLAIGILLIFFWAYEAFDLWASPWLTAWVVLTYFAAAFAIDGIFRGAAFCKYVCPIGQFNFVHSLVSPLEVKVRRPALCGACTTKDCISGRYEPKQESGAPGLAPAGVQPSLLRQPGASGNAPTRRHAGASALPSPSGHSGASRNPELRGRPDTADEKPVSLKPDMDGDGRLSRHAVGSSIQEELTGQDAVREQGSAHHTGARGDAPHVGHSGVSRNLSSPDTEGQTHAAATIASLRAQAPDKPHSAGLRLIQSGCELWLFQERKVGNMDCTFCLDCVQACPYDNVGIQLRAPTAELRRLDAWRSGVGAVVQRTDIAALVIVLVFAAFVNAFGMVPPVYALEEWLAAALGVRSEPVVLGVLFVVGLIALPFALVTLAAWLSRALSGGQESLGETVTRYSFALIPIGFGMWLAHYAFHFLIGALTVVPVAQSFLADFGVPFLGEPRWELAAVVPDAWLVPLELLLLELGMLVSLTVGFRIARQQHGSAAGAARALLPWAALILALFASGAWLMTQPMEMRGVILG